MRPFIFAEKDEKFAPRYAGTDRQWAVMAPLLSGKETDRDVTVQDKRLFFNAGLWTLRTGAPWAALPERFGKFHSVCRRFRRLAQKGVFEALKEPDLAWVMLASTMLRAYQHAAGQKKSDPETECLGRSGGGMSPKIHACTDALGNAVRLVATGGQAGDGPQAIGLLDGLSPGQVFADTSYDSNENRAYCAKNTVEVVIPNRPPRTDPAPFDEEP